MEKSLPATIPSNKDIQQPVLEPHLIVTGRYDTRLIPHISLPQRRQKTNIEKHSGLLGPGFQRSTESYEDAGLTRALNKQEIAQSIIMAQQIQGAPTLASISTTFTNTSKHPYMQDQTTQCLQGPIVPEYTGQLVFNSPHKRQSGEEQEIDRVRAQILTKAFGILALFAGIGGVIWIFFSHNAIYLLVMFVILAIMLGSVLSKLIGDYYQFSVHGVRPALHLHTSANTDALQGVGEPYPHTKSDTSGYLHALTDPLYGDTTKSATDLPLQ